MNISVSTHAFKIKIGKI